MTTPEERLIASARALIEYARTNTPETLREGGVLHELAESIRAYDEGGAHADEGGADTEGGVPDEPGGLAA